LLLALYLSRSGKARIEDIAANLNLSKSFLEQIARQLRIAKVVTSVRGPNGGFTLSEGVTVNQVLNALDVPPILSLKESFSLQAGKTEHRALVNFIGAVGYELNKFFNSKIADISEALVLQEMAQLNSLSDTSTAN
jgi:Rrf2 family protein